MIIGIYADALTSSGGVYQYTYNIISCLKKYDAKNSYVIFTHLPKNNDWEQFNGKNCKLLYLNTFLDTPKNDSISQIISYLKNNIIKIKWLYILLDNLKNYITKNIANKSAFDQVDLMIFPARNTLSYSLGKPCIVAIHDLQHRLQPEFPEVSQDGEWSTREDLFKNITQKAAVILVDSDVGKEDVMNLYGTPQEKIKVLPYFPPSYLLKKNHHENQVDVKGKYGLPEKYIFYPAQFWPHKNHLRLIKALHIVKTKYQVEISAVLVGSTKVTYSSYNEVMNLVQELHMEKQVFYLGYIPAEDMTSLYLNALALVMPTFFGPTNIPILEAFALGCPVISSNIRGVSEQVGTAGLLADPKNVEEIAEAIYKLYAEPELRNTLIGKGLKKTAEWTEADFARRLITIIEECGTKLGKIDTNQK